MTPNRDSALSQAKDSRDPIGILREQMIRCGWSTLLIDEIRAREDAMLEALALYELKETLSAGGQEGVSE